MIEAEEQARANFYALLARLFYAPPDPALLQSIAASGEIEAEDRTLAAAWRDLAAACAAADPESVRDEYDSVFVGTGKAPVTLYTCAYTLRYTNEVPLVELRSTLAALGLARRSEASEPEDHIAALCDTMRHLVAEQHDTAEQKRFFDRWIGPTVDPLCSAIEKSERTLFYKHVGRFAKSFFQLEQSAFEML
jgi:TorA maturation chaperone TorD